MKLTDEQKLWLADRHADVESWLAWIYNPESGLKDPDAALAEQLAVAKVDYENRLRADGGAYRNRAQRKQAEAEGRDALRAARKAAFHRVHADVLVAGLNGDPANDAIVELAASRAAREASAAVRL